MKKKIKFKAPPIRKTNIKTFKNALSTAKTTNVNAPPVKALINNIQTKKQLIQDIDTMKKEYDKERANGLILTTHMSNNKIISTETVKEISKVMKSNEGLLSRIGSGLVAISDIGLSIVDNPISTGVCMVAGCMPHLKAASLTLTGVKAGGQALMASGFA